MASSTAVRTSAAAVPDRHAAYNKTRLFLVSSLALVTAGVASSIRADTASEIQHLFLDTVDPVHSAAMIANVLAVPFLGFALTIALCSPLLDYMGMGIFLVLSAVFIGAGSLVMMFAGHFAGSVGVYNALWGGALIAGIGWGLVETVINPLMATLYPDEKTAKLNAMHAWWPGGLIIGGLLGVALGNGTNWELKLALVAIPAVLVVLLAIGLKFPPTERQAAGVSAGEMFRELANPMFFVLFCSMFMTAASELAPGQWVDLALYESFFPVVWDESGYRTPWLAELPDLE